MYNLPVIVFGFSCVVLLIGCGGSSNSTGAGNETDNGNTAIMVSTSLGANGTIEPVSAQPAEGDTIVFTLTPADGFIVSSASGCGGSLAGNVFTTAPVIGNCTVTAAFAEVGTSSLNQINYIKASNTDADDGFGMSAALNEDGSILVVGAPNEASADGTEEDNSRANGAVYVFSNNGSGWMQQSYVKPAVLPQPMQSPELRLRFGDSVTVNDDGTTIAVAAPGESTVSIQRGAVYIFDYIDDSWVEQALLKTVNSDGFANRAGFDVPTVAIDGAGDTLVVGEFFDSSVTNSINGDETDDDAPGAGAAHVYVRTMDGWMRQAFLKGSAVQPADQFGSSIAISGDGNTIAVGARENASIDPRSGSVYVFTRSGDAWSEQQRIQPPATTSQFGTSVSLSHSGDVLAVGVNADSTTGTGVGTDPSTCCVVGSGAAFTFIRSGDSWTQDAYFKAASTDISDQFGRTISINSNGDRFVVGAIGEASNAAGINGDQTNNTVPIAGAAYVFSRVAGTWIQDAYLKSANPRDFGEFGEAVHISGNGVVVAVGESAEASNATGIDGDSSNTDFPFAGAVHVFRE